MLPVAAKLVLHPAVVWLAMRAFGEMVAVLWGNGQCAAAIVLEVMWNHLQSAEQYPLFCAYPRSSFGNDASASIQSVCAAHSRIVPGYAP